jgi:hypothetical protein
MEKSPVHFMLWLPSGLLLSNLSMDIVHRRVIENCSSLDITSHVILFIARVLVLVPVPGIQLEMLGLTC